MNKKENVKNASYPFSAGLVIKNLSHLQIKAIHNAIKPETTVEVSTRAKAEISIEEEKLKMDFFAKDFVSLRAILGSYLRWLEVAIKSVKDLPITA